MLNNCTPIRAAVFLVLASALTSIAAPCRSQEPTASQLHFFEAKVRPLLAKHCYQCHAEDSDKVRGGLLLDSKEGWMAGGDSGDVIEVGSADESLLMESVRYKNSDLQMPPKYQLEDAEIEILESWIEMGAPDPRTGNSVVKPTGIDWEKGKSHWAFQPVSNPKVPAVNDSGWARDDLDRFILTQIEAARLIPAPDADRFAMIRRVTFDLTGLPPTVEEVDAFVNDAASDDEAITSVVDRLLDSPGFGERWGRHWLDVARYADSVGKTRNIPFPHAWRYRNYVIDALNADKPYDQFVAEQIAGDLLKHGDEKDRQEKLVATGFLALGSMDLNERDRDQFQLDRIDDQMDTTGRSIMGLTLGCARCHDHKFDPIAQTDYYAMAGIFASTKTLSGQQNRQGGNKEYYQTNLLVRLNVSQAFETTQSEPVEAASSVSVRKNHSEITRLKDRLQVLQAEQKRPGLSKAAIAELRQQLAQVRKQINRLTKADVVAQTTNGKAYGNEGKVDPNATFAMGAVDGNVTDLALRVRGEPDIKGDVVPRNFPVIFNGNSPFGFSDAASGRLELAQWLSSPENPLTARVMVNRIWAHLLGRGLVETVDNFGASGAEPTHAELLDHLAVRFVNQGWSIKSLVRTIVLSRTYRLSGKHLPSNAAVDQDNRLYWRANLRRLEAEAIRDSLLVVGGMLNTERPKDGPFDGNVNTDLSKVNNAKRRGPAMDPLAQPIRSVYLPVYRSRLPGMFTVFDFAEPDQVNGQRDVTTVPPQALFMLNNPLVIDVANRAAEQILLQNLADDAARVRYAYAWTLSRYPTEAETARALTFLNSGEDSKSSWAALTQALCSSAEFRYIP